MTITKGMKLIYNGFGSNVGSEYIVTKTDERKTVLNGKVFGRPSSFPIRTKDLVAAIASGDYKAQ